MTHFGFYVTRWRTRYPLVVSHAARDATRIGAEWRGPRTALRTVGMRPRCCEPHYKPNARAPRS